MKQRLRILAVVCLLFMLTIQITGCTFDIWTTVEENAKKDVEITVDFIPLTEVVEGRPDIYVIVKSMTSSYWTVVLDGVKQAGIDNECNIYAAGGELETEWELQEAYVELAMERNAAGIILGPDNSVKLSPVVDKVHEKGIPIIIVDTIVNTENYDICYMTDNLLAGEQAAKQMIGMFEAQGRTEDENIRVAIELGAKASQTINERLAGFCQYWTKYAPENWKLEDGILCNDGDEQVAREISEEYIRNNPDIDGVFGTDNASTMGFASAVHILEARNITLVGFDSSPEVNELIESDEYNAASVVQNQYDMGYKGVASIKGLSWGERGSLKFVDTGVTIIN